MSACFHSSQGFRIEYAWGGIVAFTRDQMPHAGQLDGLYYAGGYCGHGIAMATSLGEAIARRIAGEAIEHPLFDDRFPRDPVVLGQSLVSAVGRRLLQGAGLASVDLEFTSEQMRAMADAVVERCIEHIASLPAQPSCGDVDMAESASCAGR